MTATTLPTDREGFRALTLHRPWPQLVFADIPNPKNPEQRDELFTKWRGPLFIHAGLKWDPDGEAKARELGLPYTSPEECPTGYLGLVTLTDVHDNAFDKCECDPFWADRHMVWHWVFTDVRRFTAPYPLRGRQGLFIPPQELIDALPTLLPAGGGS